MSISAWVIRKADGETRVLDTSQKLKSQAIERYTESRAWEGGEEMKGSTEWSLVGHRPGKAVSMIYTWVTWGNKKIQRPHACNCCARIWCNLWWSSVWKAFLKRSRCFCLDTGPLWLLLNRTKHIINRCREVLSFIAWRRHLDVRRELALYHATLGASYAEVHWNHCASSRARASNSTENRYHHVHAEMLHRATLETWTEPSILSFFHS